MQDMVAANFYHYNPLNETLESFPIPGTDVQVVKVAGLAGSLQIVGTYGENLYYGTDMTGDEEDVKVWFSEDNQTYRLLVKWSSGVQFAFPAEVVLGTFAQAPTF